MTHTKGTWFTIVTPSSSHSNACIATDNYMQPREAFEDGVVAMTQQPHDHGDWTEEAGIESVRMNMQRETGHRVLSLLVNLSYVIVLSL
jgi:hypothetical protein